MVFWRKNGKKFPYGGKLAKEGNFWAQKLKKKSFAACISGHENSVLFRQKPDKTALLIACNWPIHADLTIFPVFDWRKYLFFCQTDGGKWICKIVFLQKTHFVHPKIVHRKAGNRIVIFSGTSIKSCIMFSISAFFPQRLKILEWNSRNSLFQSHLECCISKENKSDVLFRTGKMTLYRIFESERAHGYRTDRAHFCRIKTILRQSEG